MINVLMGGGWNLVFNTQQDFNAGCCTISKEFNSAPPFSPSGNILEWEKVGIWHLRTTMNVVKKKKAFEKFSVTFSETCSEKEMIVEGNFLCNDTFFFKRKYHFYWSTD